MQLGPIMCDLGGIELAEDEHEMLQHPLIGGVLLFTRNYHSTEQIRALIADIHSLRKPSLLIAVDHEGGRIQRFQEGLTHLPPAQILGEIYRKDRQLAARFAEQLGWLMAAELGALNIDLSFAPVLDRNHVNSGVIGDRAIDQDVQIIATLATCQMRGMQNGGMQAVGKHFPGHGSIAEDSHITMPVDQRPLADICAQDMIPFKTLIKNELPGIMSSHISFPQVDCNPVSFSSVWLQEILRQQLNFKGAIFSDDIDMLGAAPVGDHLARAK